MKVCDRAYVTEDEEEESMSEHSYSPGICTDTHTHTLKHFYLQLVFVSTLMLWKTTVRTSFYSLRIEHNLTI